MSIDESDFIRIEGLEISARIGVPEEERASPQRLDFNILLWPVRSFQELEDDIVRAVNYAAVCADVRNVVARRSDRLIETLAGAVASHLLESFPVRKVRLEVRKYILPEVDFVSVTVTRERPND